MIIQIKQQPVFSFIYFENVFVLDGCSCGWTAYNGFCYHVSSTTRTRDQAQKYCQRRGANLVKILSAEENDFVLALSHKFAPYKKGMWIGLKFWKEDKKYHWTDGSQMSYTNWALREPNGFAREPCAHIYTDPKRTQLNALAGTWNDLQCGLQKNFHSGTVCEKLA